MDGFIHIRPHRRHRSAMAKRRMGAAFAQPISEASLAAAGEMPTFAPPEPESTRRTVLTGTVAFLLHGGVVAVLLVLASLTPLIEEEIIPVTLLRPDKPPPKEEPAPARKALAERRALPFAPQAQTIQPQVVNPRVVADAAPVVQADQIQMDAVNTVAAPRQVARANVPTVERLSAVNSIASARASSIDAPSSAGPVVRGPTRIDAPAGPSVGPRRVEVNTNARSMGTGTLSIGEGSSVREGVISNRDVLGSPDGAPLVSVNVAIGDGEALGSGGTGTSLAPGGSASPTTSADCLKKREVQAYMGVVRDRMLERWQLPPGVPGDQEVTLRFQLDVAGSASAVQLVRADDNALGASAVDALRAASPFPPLPEPARCLAQRRLVGTFSNPSG